MGRARDIANLIGGATPDVILKTSDGAILNLQTSDTTVVASDVLGAINFQAPNEASGTDSILIASKIEAVAESTFSASSNATSVIISTASSEAAGTAGGKFTFGSTGNLTIKDMRTADGSSARITLQSGDTDIAQDDIIGQLEFQAPDEGTGTDAILLAAAIGAVSEGDFSSSSNATKLSFKTGASEAASEKMSLGSGGDLSILTDGASLFFGADSEIELRHVADDGLIIKHVGTGDGKEPSLTFQAGDNDIAQDDILGSIFFQAPDEGAGTDAVLVSAGIEAISEGDFSSSSNATSLRFLTGASETAAEKMRIASDGKILVNHTSSQTMGPTTEPQIQIEGTDNHTGSMSIIRNSNDNGQSLLILGKSRGTSVNANTVVQDDDNVGEVLFVAADGSDKTPQVASIKGAVDGTPGSNDMPGRLAFSTTADSGQTITERMRIDSGGKVLVGTTASRSMFTVSPNFFIEGTTFDDSSMGIVTNRNDGNGGFLFLGKSKGTSLGSSTVVSSGNDLGAIAFAAADGTDMESIAAMIVGGISDDVSPGANDVPGTLKFATASDGATAATHRMSIDHVGRIRLGSDGELKHRLISQQTTGVGTSAATIATVGTFATFGAHYFITGRNADSTTARFCDQLTAGLNGSINVLHSTTVRGSPASRSYSLSSENLQVAMGSGSNYTINVFAIDQVTN